MAIRSFRHALARLEQIRDGKPSGGGEAAPESAENAASIVERIVAAAARSAEEALAKANGEIHRRLARMEQELAEARDARTRAESALNEERSSYEARIRAAEAQAVAARAEMEVARLEVARLKKVLDTDATTRARLLDALQTIQQVVGPSAGLPLAASVVSPVVDTATVASAEDKTAMAAPLKLVASKPAATPKIDRELDEYVVQLFEQIQAAYDTDAKDANDAAALVNRLEQNVRHAYSMFRRRAESANGEHSTAFEDYLNTLLNTVGESAFGRHLAIASYSYATADSQGQSSEAEAS